ncbi:MAG: hypothetical protein P1P84_21525 [Deferrisomatales bacterium]|nr:hypothetical protein [Deferrisomatales bacterium]
MGRGTLCVAVVSVLCTLGWPAIAEHGEKHGSKHAKDIVEWQVLLEAQRAQIEALEARVGDLESALAQVRQSKLFLLEDHVRVESGELNGLRGPHVIVERANLHVRSGSGSTGDDDGSSGTLVGLGNLIVGYNEVRLDGVTNRGGSHNLVVGVGHNYPSYGGLLAGEENTVSWVMGSVVGGWNNEAAGWGSTVLGGADNRAVDAASSVCGGAQNKATGYYATVSGGTQNVASGTGAAVAGGEGNVASGVFASVGGGSGNTASGYGASVGGGPGQVASGDFGWKAGEPSP